MSKTIGYALMLAIIAVLTLGAVKQLLAAVPEVKVFSFKPITLKYDKKSTKEPVKQIVEMAIAVSETMNIQTSPLIIIKKEMAKDIAHSLKSMEFPHTVVNSRIRRLNENIRVVEFKIDYIDPKQIKPYTIIIGWGTDKQEGENVSL